MPKSVKSVSSKPSRTRLPTFLEFLTWLGVSPSPAQTVIAKVAFDKVPLRSLDEKEWKLAQEIFGFVDPIIIPEEAYSKFGAVCGARAGKSYILSALRLLHLALTVDLSELAPGEVASAVIVAPEMRLGKQTYRYIVGAADLKKADLKPDKWDGSDVGMTVMRHDGKRVAIEVLPATKGGSATRARTLVGAVCDECCFFRDEEYQVNDQEIVNSLDPRILPDGQLIMPSTPWVEGLGELWRIWNENFGKPKDALVAHAPSLLLRPNSNKLRIVVERARKTDPDNAAREFDAVFMPATRELFFDPNAIQNSTSTLPLPRKLEPHWPRCVAADFGFKYDSSTAVCVAYDGNKYILIDLIELRPKQNAPLKPSETVAEIAEFTRRHGCTHVIADQFSREPIREYLSQHGLGITEPPEAIQGKMETYLRARAMLHQDRCEIPEHARLKNQMRAVIQVPTAGGKLSIRSPRKKTQGHGDLVSAWVLGVHKLAFRDVLEPPKVFKEGSPEYEKEWCRKEQSRMLDNVIQRMYGRKDNGEDTYDFGIQ